MKIYDVITTNIKNYMEKFEKDVDFKANYPDISIISYLSKQTGLTIRRLNDILNGRAKIRIFELGRIADALHVPITALVDDGTFDGSNKPS